MSRPHNPHIEAYLRHLTNRRASPRTITTYRGVLYRADAELPYGLGDADDTELTAWLTNPGWSAKTQALYTTILSNFYSWGLKGGRCEHDPTEAIEMPALPHRLPRPATLGEVRTILAATPDPGWTPLQAANLPQVQLWSRIAAFAGARAIEIARLDRGDISEQAIRLLGKGSKERLVPTHGEIWAAVRDLPPGPIAMHHIATRRGIALARCDERQISNRAWRAYRLLGLDLGIHRLRAFFATAALQATGDLSAVQDLLGHASPATTRIYASPSASQLRAAVAAVPALSASEPGD